MNLRLTPFSINSSEILALYFDQFPFADLLLAYDLERRWQKLFKSALQRNQSLQVVKSKFAEMTSKEVDTFNVKVCFRWVATQSPPHFHTFGTYWETLVTFPEIPLGQPPRSILTAFFSSTTLWRLFGRVDQAPPTWSWTEAWR